MTSLRIAQVAPPWLQVPPVSYGGIEWVVSALADGLHDAGHDVTVFAPGGSSTKARLVSPMDAPPAGTERIGELIPELFHALACYVQSSNFDVIHDHTGFAGPALGTFSKTPVVVTLHGSFVPDMRHLYEMIGQRISLVAISSSQRAEMPGLNYAGIVHNGIDVESFEFRERKESKLAYIGRFTPEKGAHTALEVAHQLEMPLVLNGKAAEPHEKTYVQERIVPALGPDDDFRGEVTEDAKRTIMAEACCVLFPIRWQEPFGLVMIESMASGTPVVAFRQGAVEEVVVHGKTGFVVDTADQMVEAVKKVNEIDPATCRRHVQDNFSAAAMVRGYEKIYRDL